MPDKKWFFFAAVALMLGCCLLWPGVWDMFRSMYPTREINLTVPYAPGGSTDRTARMLAKLMSEHLGENIVVANTPADGGVAGYRAVYRAPRDGYTLLAHGMIPFTSMAVRGYAEDTHRSWHVWLATSSPNVVVVRSDSVFRNMGMLVTALHTRPEKVAVGQAGMGSAGQLGVSALQQALGVSVGKVRTYSGGKPAVKAVLDGEVDFAAQLLADCETEIRSGQLRALSSFTDADIVVVNGPVVPTVLRTVPQMEKYLPKGEITGIAVPKGIPKEVLQKLDEAFEAAVNSKEFMVFCRNSGFMPAVRLRESAERFLDRLAPVVSWSLYDAGEAKTSPAMFGMSRP